MNYFKKIYYRWVINNLEADLFELTKIKDSQINWLMEDERLLELGILDIRMDLDRAKLKLKRLEK
tara:strand:- start:6890 stop:7084 length:195 start_codon:yes stop_codon:yes gene_type:complete